MRATAEVIEGNRVKLSVEVPEDELQAAEAETINRLVREARIPGFRPGKVPRRLLVQRLGPRAIRDEVLREALPDYYEQAVEDTELDIISAPEIDITSGEESGPLAFDAVVEVRPRVGIAGYEGLEVTVPSPDVSDEEIDEQVDRLRDQFATLKEVDRPAIDGDHVTLNVTATRDGEPVEGLSADDLVYPVGSDGLVPGADEKLRGTKVGAIVEVDVPDAAGGPAQVRILVKQVREKVIPDADDAWAEEASEFDTLEELRNDIRTRITPVRRTHVVATLRENAVEALAELVNEDIPESLVNAELERRLADLNNYLESRRVGLDTYLEVMGKTADELITELTATSTAAVRADLALRALADVEEIEVSDEELADQIDAMAARQRKSPAEVLRRLDRSGQLPELRSEIRKSKAVTWLVEHVGVVDDQGNPVDRTALFDDEADDGEGTPGDIASATGETSEGDGDELVAAAADGGEV
jgi:trigger factor